MVDDEREAEKAAAETNDGVEDMVGVMTSAAIDEEMIELTAPNNVDEYLQLEAKEFLVKKELHLLDQQQEISNSL